MVGSVVGGLGGGLGGGGASGDEGERKAAGGSVAAVGVGEGGGAELEINAVGLVVCLQHRAGNCDEIVPLRRTQYSI